MPTKHIKRRSNGALVQVIISAVAGMAIVLLLASLGALLMLKGALGEKHAKALLLFAIFIGCALASAMNGKVIKSIIPKVLTTSGSFILLLILLTAAVQQGNIIGPLFPAFAATAVAGSTTGIVTNLVKSNKSYIIKSKRKRMIP